VGGCNNSINKEEMAFIAMDFEMHFDDIMNKIVEEEHIRQRVDMYIA